MMRTRQLCLILAGFLALGVAPAAWAGAPTDQLKTYIDQVLKILEDPVLKVDGKVKERRTAVRQVADDIFDFAETDRFVKEVRWSMGDIIIWDNRFLSHTSGRNSGPEEETMMHRITLKDDYPLCASQIVAQSTAA